MARIFTTKFTFNHKDYNAIVTMLMNDDILHFKVKIMGTELHEMLPGGELRYEGKNGLKGLDTPDQLPQPLVRSIASSIEKHLLNGT